MAREIPLTRGLAALVDDEDYDRIAAQRWIAKPADQAAKRWYAYRSENHNSRKLTIYMHRLVVQAPDHLLVDHINGDGLDNRRANLRLATRAQNCTHRAYALTVGGYRGVHPTGKGTYRARLETDGLVIRVSGALNAEQAARAYDAIAIEFQGEFAVLNFPRNSRRPAIAKAAGPEAV